MLAGAGLTTDDARLAFVAAPIQTGHHVVTRRRSLVTASEGSYVSLPAARPRSAARLSKSGARVATAAARDSDRARPAVATRSFQGSSTSAVDALANESDRLLS
jgi:hypothetical protein